MTNHHPTFASNIASRTMALTEAVVIGAAPANNAAYATEGGQRIAPATRAAGGFTLVELMVAMTIGLILTIAVVQIFSATRSSYQVDEGLARAQENGRFAIEFLSREIRHAGHLGCRRDVPSDLGFFSAVNYLVGAAPLPQISNIVGQEFAGTGPGTSYAIPASPTNTTTGWSPALDAAVRTSSGAGALPGSDVIAVERMVSTGISLAAGSNSFSLFIPVPQVNLIKDGDVLMVSDCGTPGNANRGRGAIFQVTSVIAGTGQVNHALGGGPPGNRCAAWANNNANPPAENCPTQWNYPEGAMLGAASRVYFYVARNPDPANNRPTLYQNTTSLGGVGADNPTPLVEGVENMQILYGVDETSPADQLSAPTRYVAADNVADFRRVVSVRLGVLVQSINVSSSTVTDIQPDTDTYNMAGTTVDPQDDNLRRRVFSTTIQLRNRGP